MGHINDSRGSQWLPRCISGGSKPTGGWGIDPLPEVSRRHTAPRRGNGRERYLQNPWRGVIPVAGRMHLGVTHGGRQGRGWGIDPFSDASRRRHTAPRRGNGRERYLQNPWRGGIPVAWRMHLGVTHGGRKGRGRGIYPFPDISRRGHTAPRRGNRQGRYLQNPWKGGIPVAWQMHLGVTHGGRKGRGGALAP